MLYISYQGLSPTSPPLQREWQIGDRQPEIPAQTIIEIGADGEELLYIKDLFREPHGGHSIPMPHKNVCRWDGDFARTIWLNL